MDRVRFEDFLRRRTSRRLAVGGAAAGIVGVSLKGRATRSYARQSSSDGTPVASPVADLPLQSRASVRFGIYPFQLGVASGDPGPNSVVLWTRLAPTPIDSGGMDPLPYEVGWEIAGDDGFTDVVQSGVTVAHPVLSHSVHVDVTGLESGREFYYRFQVGGEISPVGRTKTAPAAGQAVDELRFAFASCSNYEHGYFGAYRHLAEQRFDLVLHLGDYIYEYAFDDYNVREPENLRPVGGGETMTLQHYRNRHALYHTDLDLQAAHASAPFVVTWDDHEVENNYAGEISENEDPAAEFLRRRADAYQAYYEHMPLRASSVPMGPHMGLYRHLPYGDLMDVTVLDTRQYRSDHPNGDGEYPYTPASLDPATSLLGPAQERWLTDRLDASRSRWNVMAQQVIMADAGYEFPAGSPEYHITDWWDGYPVARQRLLSHIAEGGAANPVVLTGDVHSSWANDVRLDADDQTAAPIATEYVCTSITAGGTEPSGWVGDLAAALPHVRFADGRHGGYSAATLTRERWTTDFLIVDDMENPESGVSSIGTFVTEAGTPGAQPM